MNKVTTINMYSYLMGLLPLTVLVVVGCNEASEYEQLVQRELSKGVEYNELFLGYQLGMLREEFYDHSWELNRKGLVMQGPQNQTVQYELDDELSHSAKMYYYPDFYEGRIFQMRVRFKYDGWAPWNRDLSSDSLQVDVVELFEDWYGDGFIELEGGSDYNGKSIEYVKIDGNRRIVVAEHTPSEVVAVFTDIVVEKEVKKYQDQNSDERIR